MTPNKRQLLSIVLAFVSAVGLSYFFGFGHTSNYLLFFVTLAAALAIIRPAAQQITRRRFIFALVFALPFSLATLVGSKITYATTEFAPWVITDPLKFLGLFLMISALVIDLLAFVDRRQFRLAPARHPQRLWLIATLILLACWLPYFLICCPGLISVDTAVQFRQGITGSALSNWHPILHTLFLGLFLNLGNALGGLTLGISFAVFAQMLVVAILLGYTVHWAATRLKHRGFYLGILAFYALCPIVATYAITPWKDVIFSSILLVLVLKIYDFVHQYRRTQKLSIKGLLPLAIIAFISAFFRNGGLATLIILTLSFLIYYRRSWRAVLLTFLPFTLLVAVIQGPIYKACQIASSPFMESLSIPAQQIAYTAQYGDLTDDELERLSHYVEVEHLVSVYNPMHADAAKTSFAYDRVEENKADFLQLWASILSHNLPAYIKAYIYQTYAYWYVGSPSWVASFENTHDHLWLDADYQDVNLFGDQAKSFLEFTVLGTFATSWFGWLCSVGVLVWSVLLALLVYLYKKSAAATIAVLTILGYLATLFIASPVSWIYRYVYILLLALPFLISFCFIAAPRAKQ